MGKKKDEIKDMIPKLSGPPAEPGTIKFVGLLAPSANIRPEERLTDEEIRQMHPATGAMLVSPGS